MTNVGRVQSKRKRESHESCVSVLGFSACMCQSILYETECRFAAFQLGKQDQNH